MGGQGKKQNKTPPGKQGTGQKKKQIRQWGLLYMETEAEKSR